MLLPQSPGTRESSAILKQGLQIGGPQATSGPHLESPTGHSPSWVDLLPQTRRLYKTEHLLREERPVLVSLCPTLLFVFHRFLLTLNSNVNQSIFTSVFGLQISCLRSPQASILWNFRYQWFLVSLTELVLRRGVELICTRGRRTDENSRSLQRRATTQINNKVLKMK